jgi:nicotinamide-nucleotide amidase
VDTGQSVNFTLKSLSAALLAERFMLCTAESCTGGMIAAACTDLAGSSRWFERGFVTYSNQAKTEMLGVSAALIEQHGAVSELVARAMAVGAVARSGRGFGSDPTANLARISVAVTGVAGPGGGTAAKPVGTVCFAWDVLGTLKSEVRQFEGDRAAVRQATVAHALARLLELVRTS